MNYRDYKRMALSNHAEPATIEAGVLAIRSEMIDTLSRLEDRLSPRKLFDQIMQRGRSISDTPSQFVSNLGEVVRDNPVSVVLLVGGAASLLNAERHLSRPRGAETDLRERAEGAVERAQGTVERVEENIAERKQRLGERAHDVKRRAHDAGERAQAKRAELQGRARERFTSAREQGRKSFDEARSRGERMIHEEPLLLAGIGLALGAIAGARVRLSDREQRVFEAARRPEPTTEQSDVVQRAAAAIERDESKTPPQREFAIEGEFETKIVEGAIPPDPNPGPPSTGGRSL